MPSSIALSLSSGWHCELCGHRTPPVVGGLLLTTAARHHCRECHRTVCDGCSSVPSGGLRLCKGCYLHAASTSGAASAPREKYIFLVRHAQSTWNQKIDVMKSVRHFSMDDVSFKQVVSGAAQLMACDVWHRDHPISEVGSHQTASLQQKIAETRRLVAKSAEHSSEPRLDTDRELRYYRRFLEQRNLIYSSPLLRALQTAHMSLPEGDGWGSIKLLKDARERFTFVFERDCLGTGVGSHIVSRAQQMGHEMTGLQQRVDASDCNEKWWSDEPETEADMESRLDSLWHQLCEDDPHDHSCVLVTHSNLIKALLMRHGDVGGETSCSSSGGMVEQSAPAEAGRGADEVDGLSRDSEDEQDSVMWQVVSDGSESLRRLKVDRLQNCGVLGLRCEAQCEDFSRGPYREVDGWIDLDPAACAAESRGIADSRWVAKDALLMFESVLVR